MSATAKHTTTEKGFGPAVESSQVKSYDNDPFVIKKLEKAMQTLKKVGLPDLKK